MTAPNGADDVSIRQDGSPSNGGAAIRQVDSPMVRLLSTPDDVSIRQDNSPMVLLRLFFVKSSNRLTNGGEAIRQSDLRMN